jgi:hypothetical protein
MRPSLCLLILGWLLPFISSAQGDYTRGYIIKTNGDSLAGFVAYRDRSKNGNTCFYKADKKSQATMYSPLDVNAFGFFEGNRYESKMLPVVNGQVFTEVLVKGKMSLYIYYDIFYVETDKLRQLTDKAPKGAYISILNELIKECGLIADDTKYNSRDLSHLVQNYNRCKGGVGLTFIKKNPLTRFNFQMYAGVDISQLKIDGFDDETFNKSYSMIVGAGVELSSPQFTDKGALILEAAYLEKRYTGYYEKKSNVVMDRSDYKINASFLKVPFSIRYNFLDKPHTPYVKLGVVQYFILKSSSEVIAEREIGGIVTTQYSNSAIDGKNQVGYWFGVGYTKNVMRKTQAFIEIRYEKTNGFIDHLANSSSSTNNLTVLVGVRL